MQYPPDWIEIERLPGEAVRFREAVSKGKQIQERNQKIYELRDQEMTQQQIADEVGLSREGVKKVLNSEISESSTNLTQYERAGRAGETFLRYNRGCIMEVHHGPGTDSGIMARCFL